MESHISNGCHVGGTRLAHLTPTKLMHTEDDYNTIDEKINVRKHW